LWFYTLCVFRLSGVYSFSCILEKYFCLIGSIHHNTYSWWKYLRLTLCNQQRAYNLPALWDCGLTRLRDTLANPFLSSRYRLLNKFTICSFLVRKFVLGNAILAFLMDEMSFSHILFTCNLHLHYKTHQKINKKWTRGLWIRKGAKMSVLIVILIADLIVGEKMSLN